MRLNLANTLRKSAANGPGERFVVWVQGCPLACPGCWNRDTWSFGPRRVMEVDALAEEILAVRGIEGVTLTGGEPFVQARALASLGRIVQDAGLSVFVFTGFERAQLVGHARRELLEVTDVLVTGRYVQAGRSTEEPWRGSSNQQVWFLTERYAAEDMTRTAAAEVHVAADGSMRLTGFPPDELRAAVASS
ncbi:MAG: radical SAM protein [Myxococcales bacterium]|nr:radical SAM protein [Myxococcales bacterium]MCB9712404.1 radical SAM protein [Myxococcales bacterium]